MTSKPAPSSSPAWRERLGRWLTEPSSSSHLIRERRPRLLAGVLLTLILVGLVAIIPISLGLSTSEEVQSIQLWLVLGGLSMLLAAYFINHRGHYRVAAALTVGATVMVTWVAVLISPTAEFSSGQTLAFLIVPVMVSSVLLAARLTALLAVANTAAIAIYLGTNPLLPSSAIWTQLILVVVVSTLVIVSAALRERDEQRIDQQTRSLAESEQRFRNASDFAAIGMSLVALDGRWIQVNRALCQIVGYSEAELLQLRFQDITHPDDLNADLQHVHELLAGQTAAYQLEKRYFHKDGHIVWIQLNVSLVRDAEGNPLYFISQVQDITQRKLAEQSLQESNERYRQMLAEAERLRQFNASVADVMAEGMAIEDTEGRLAFINSRAGRLLGYAPDELVGQHWSKIVAPRFHTFVAEQSTQRPSGAAGVYECLLLTKSGEELPVLVSAAPLFESGRYTGTLTTFADISELKRTQGELEEREQRLQRLYSEAKRQAQELALMDQVHTALAGEMDLEAIFRRVVEAIQQAFGYTLVSLYLVEGDELALQHQVGYVSKIERIPVSRGVVGRVARTGRPALVEDVQLDPDFIAAQPGIVSEICVPLRDEGRVAGILNIEAAKGMRLTEADKSLLERVSVPVALAMTRARLYAEARAAERRFRTLVEQVPAITYVVSLEQGQPTLYVSPQIERTLGFTQEEWIADPALWRKQIHPDDRERVLAEDERCTHTGDPFLAEYRIFTKDGRVVWLHDETRWLRGDGGQATVAQGIEFDITERKETEEAIRQSNERLTQWLAESEQRSREIALLNQFSAQLQACLTLEEAYATVSQFLPQLFPGQGGALYILDPGGPEANKVSTWGNCPPTVNSFVRDDCWALRRGYLHVVGPGLMNPPCAHTTEQERSAYLCIPVMAQGEAQGVLYWQQCQAPVVGYSANQQQLAQTVTDTLALALSNLRLRESLRQQSIRDAVTGLFNRRYLEETLAREVNRAARNHQSLGVIMIDIDHFKQFNDAYGHEAGDVLLRHLGRLLDGHVRGADIACRYGGEEFTLILPGAPLETVRQRAELIRQAAGSMQVKHLGQSLGQITLSLGVAAFPTHGLSADDVLRAADAALYQAKDAGRDQVAVIDQPASMPKAKPGPRKTRR